MKLSLRLILSLGTVSALLFAGPVSAEEGALTLGLTGTHEVIATSPVGGESWDTGYEGVMKTPRATNEFSFEAEQGPVKLVAQGTFTTTSTGTAWTAGENYLSFSPDSLRLAAGYQIFSWGSADGVNPTDNLNARDFANLQGSKVRKLPVLAASVTWYPSEEISAEAVFVPRTTASLYPTNAATALRALGLVVTDAAPLTGASDFVAGGRINFRSTLADVSLSYLYDIDPIASPRFVGVGQVQLERTRVHRLGADLKTSIDRFGLWAEGAYSYTGNTDPAIETQRLSHGDLTLGGDFGFGPADAGYLNLQYTVSLVPGYDEVSNTFVEAFGGVTAGLTQGITWNARYNLAGDALVPSLSGSYSFTGNDLLLKPEIDLMPVDSFHLRVGGVFAFAPNATTGVGVYTAQNHLSLTVSYKWANSLSN